MSEDTGATRHPDPTTQDVDEVLDILAGPRNAQPGERLVKKHTPPPGPVAPNDARRIDCINCGMSDATCLERVLAGHKSCWTH